MLESLSQIDWFVFLRSLAPLIAVFASGAAILIYAAFAGKSGGGVAPAIAAILGLAGSFVLAWQLWPNSSEISVLTLSFDRIAIVGWMSVIAASIFSAMMSIPYLKLRQASRPEYYALILFAVFGMGVLISGSDLISILLGLETMSLAAFALTGFLKDRAVSLEGALKYFLMGAFASAFFVMGMAFILGSAGSLDLSVVAARAGDVASGEGRAFFLFGIAFVVIGFAFKVALVPFHAWAPDAYDGAPTPIAAFMATGVKAAAFVAFARVAFAVCQSAGILWHHLVFGLSVATMLVGNIAAIKQNNLKRMLAYSSIAHAGYMLTVFPSMSANPNAAIGALLLYIVAYVAMTIGAFAVLVALEPEAGEPVDIEKLSGLARRRPVLAAVFSLLLVSLAGFPPTLGFFGKYYLFLAAVKNGDALLVVIAVLASVVSVYFYLRPVVAMYFKDPVELSSDEEKAAKSALAPQLVAVLVIVVMAVITFGILPQNLVAFIQGSVAAVRSVTP